MCADHTTFMNRNDLISDHCHFSMMRLNRDKEISPVVSKIQEILQTSHLIVLLKNCFENFGNFLQKHQCKINFYYMKIAGHLGGRFVKKEILQTYSRKRPNFQMLSLQDSRITASKMLCETVLPCYFSDYAEKITIAFSDFFAIL